MKQKIFNIFYIISISICYGIFFTAYILIGFAGGLYDLGVYLLGGNDDEKGTN